MSSNPVMDNNPYFRAGMSTPNQHMVSGQPMMPNQQAMPNQYMSPGEPMMSHQQMPQNYGMPTAHTNIGVNDYSLDAMSGAMPAPQVPTGRMTYQDALGKIAVMLGVIAVVAVGTAVALPVAILPMLAMVASIATLVVSFIAGRKTFVSPGGALAYAVLEGVALGALTGYLEMRVPGIAFQAVLGTLIVAGIATALHTSGKVRTSPRGRRFVSVLLLSAIAYGLVNMVLVLAFGQRHMDFISVGGMPLGIILGLILIVAAGYSLIADLELIRNAEANGAPKEFAWTCAFGFVVTLVWIYVEVLRILSIFASADD